MYSIEEIKDALVAGYQDGYAQGLEAAANLVKNCAMPYDQLAILLQQESHRVREMGVPTEVSK